MKRIFVEPDIRKIEMNLTENIASSSPVSDEMGFYFWFHWTDCTVQHSGKLITQGVSEAELWACYSEGNAKARGGTIVPEKIVRMHMKY